MKTTLLTLVRQGAALLAGMLIAVSMTASAGTYPDRPMSVMVAYSPGGATDFQARIVTMMSAKEDFLGQPMVIVNKPGAGGQVGWNWFASEASKNGYDLAAYNIPHFIAQSIVFDTKYNINNLEPIANWGADPAVLIVNKDSPFDTAKDLVEYAKKNPGKVTVSGAGLYVGHHIATLQLEKAGGIDLNYVPTKGGVPALQFVLGGKVMAGFNNLSDAYRSRDRLKILGVADVQRDEQFLPDVPTLKEQGFDVDDSSVNFRGIMATEGTPQAVIDKLAKQVPQMFQHKKVKAKMKAGGSPMRIIKRDEVIQMWKEREEYLTELLADLRKKK
ncbi:MAG: tripartite tricarboxylate transporter substrate binding protein [Gammaproteobacteria bacterium]|nr:tripartite tricarboxylate transporter substrate binding protein [Gammaproteobacteria bacterium]NIR82522.1 tripartite tricarboxylate transporter substrate binding protein [Gammaproteobacteria bacterium]NIU03653.1 tripartite tricarboxylate transporter substrate binding protein [Gammaproteobacteria bacterium]NIX84927.1 tripartite tricarboxylate transporter substrate binding protein [Gammaproteobacteria bacterium]